VTGRVAAPPAGSRPARLGDALPRRWPRTGTFAFDRGCSCRSSYTDASVRLHEWPRYDCLPSRMSVGAPALSSAGVVGGKSSRCWCRSLVRISYAFRCSWAPLPHEGLPARLGPRGDDPTRTSSRRFKAMYEARWRSTRRIGPSSSRRRTRIFLRENPTMKIISSPCSSSCRRSSLSRRDDCVHHAAHV